MARSGYEIRLDVLRIAKDLADDRYHTTLQKKMDDATRSYDLASMEDNDATWSGYETPADNREAETLRLAKEFYAFVEDK
jgi:hypothetical protein